MKQRQTNVEETDLWKTIIRVEAQHKAWRHTLPAKLESWIFVRRIFAPIKFLLIFAPRQKLTS